MMHLSSDQRNHISAIGNDSRLPFAVRRLAWLAARACEGLGEDEIAGAVGLPVDCARFWLGVLDEHGPALFDRLAKGGNGDGASLVPISIDDLRVATGFSLEEGEFVGGLALRLFDSLGRFHGLGSHHRGLLENAALLYRLGESLVAQGSRGLFFSVLDPSVQSLPPDEMRVLGALLWFKNGKVNASILKKTSGMKGSEARATLLLIALLRMAVALNNSRTQSTVIYRVESSQLATYLILKGASSLEDAAACESAARLWRKRTGKKLRSLSLARTRLPGERNRLSLYRSRLRSSGIRADDTLSSAGRKAMRFQLAAMLRYENRVYLGQDPNALHKMRVNTRRIRSAMRLFRDGFDDKELKPHIKRFRELGRDLGVLRDIDVLRENLAAYCDKQNPQGQRSLTTPMDYFRQKRIEALIVAREYLRSRRYLDFVRSFHDLVEDTEDSQAVSTARVSQAAPVHIYQRLAGVRESGQELESASVERLHQLRIRFKQLRYAFEFYEDVLAEAAKSIVETLRRAQNELGALQDSERACEMIDEYLREATPSDGDVRTAVEEYRRHRTNEQQPAIDAFRETWAKFDSLQMRANIALAVARL